MGMGAEVKRMELPPSFDYDLLILHACRPRLTCSFNFKEGEGNYCATKPGLVKKQQQDGIMQINIINVSKNYSKYLIASSTL